MKRRSNVLFNSHFNFQLNKGTTMKKTYITPTTEKIETELGQLICTSKYTLKRYGQWGASEAQSLYGNNAWLNEGNKGVVTAGGFTAVDMEDDNGTLPSRSNEALW